jgi:hypothetical protein
VSQYQAGRFSPDAHPGANTLLWLDPKALLQRTGSTGPSDAVPATDVNAEAAYVVIAEALGKFSALCSHIARAPALPLPT